MTLRAAGSSELAVMPAFRWHPQRCASCPALRGEAEDSRAAERQHPPGRGPRARERRLQARLAQQPPPNVPTVAACARRAFRGTRVVARRNALAGSSSSSTPSGPARPFRLARVLRPGMTNTDVRPLRNGAAWSYGVDERVAAGTLAGGRKAGKVVDADNDHLIARQADRAVDVADGTGPASSRTPHPPGRAGRPAGASCASRRGRFRPLPRTPSRGLAAALRGLTHEGLIIIYDQIQTGDEGVVSQPGYTLAKPSNGPNDRDHLKDRSGGRTSPINTLRSEVLGHARKQAAQPPGLFTLTVPTGGGKTLTSLAFALDHALRHGLERVIYVIPYMSIIEQTCAVFRAALREGDEDPADFVVEHHSTFDEDRISKAEARDKLRLAMENWDAPIIVTTAVQFFESLFANRPSRCRKLHNIANSVVILDEAQTLPLHLLRPCVAALDELARHWRASVVLCTATQPALSQRDGFAEGFENVRELAPDPPRLYTELKRTRIQDAGTLEDAELAARLRDSPQVLCIVNTRRHAQELYEQLGDAEGSCHLSTLMCAAHRREALEAVRKRLEEGEPVRLVATSLVEAGVDVDFPVVWRAAAGLESIIQAAGRCNREGRRDTGDVFVFEPTGAEGRKPPPAVAQNADAARTILRQFSDDPAALEAIRAYFGHLYWVKGDEALDSKNIMRMISEQRRRLDFPFETIAREFRLIDEIQVPVVTPWRGANGKDGTAERLLEKLKHVERPGWIARQLQPYIVQIGRAARDTLLAAGAVEIVREAEFGEQFVRLVNADLYQEDTGLSLENPTYRRAEGLVY